MMGYGNGTFMAQIQGSNGWDIYGKVSYHFLGDMLITKGMSVHLVEIVDIFKGQIQP